VPEVVREPRMHYYKVPRLGCYMAVPLVYGSCLTEEALDAAIADYFQVKRQQMEQDKMRAEWEEEQERTREEKEKLGELFEPEERQWDEIQPRPLETVKECFVVCLDTLGQDRELSPEERRFALQTVKSFREIWEKTEADALLQDRDR